MTISADVCLMTPEQAGAVRAAVAQATGLAPEAVLLACTHTHSAPDTGLGELRSGRPLPAWVPGLMDGIARAGCQAWASRAPARGSWHRAEARIGRNRRLADGPCDPAVDVLWLREREGGRSIGMLWRHGCHGTVLGHDNLEISGDWMGATAAQLERELGGVCAFVLGAHADIDPRTRGLMDLAIDGQSLGLGHDAVYALGSEVASAIRSAIALPGRPLDSVAALARRVSVPVRLGDLPAEARAAALVQRRSELADALGLAPDALPRTADLHACVRERCAGRPVEELRAKLGLARALARDRLAPFFCGAAERVDVEVQLLALGPVALLGLPLECTTEVGLDWRARCAGRAEGALVSIANGWLRYLPHAKDFAHPEAGVHYEVLNAALVDEAAETLLRSGVELLREALA